MIFTQDNQLMRNKHRLDAIIFNTIFIDLGHLNLLDVEEIKREEYKSIKVW